jgi:hypothetical protein
MRFVKNATVVSHAAECACVVVPDPVTHRCVLNTVTLCPATGHAMFVGTEETEWAERALIAGGRRSGSAVSGHAVGHHDTDACFADLLAGPSAVGYS